MTTSFGRAAWNFLDMISPVSVRIMKEVRSVIPAQVDREAEQRRFEAAWEASWLSYEQARRRQIVVEWMHHHERLAGVFHGHGDRHERERDHYQRLLADMHTTTEGEANV